MDGIQIWEVVGIDDLEGSVLHNVLQKRKQIKR